MPTILLLILSNCFMTTAWYWHLKGGMDKPIVLVIAISWGSRCSNIASRCRQIALAMPMAGAAGS